MARHRPTIRSILCVALLFVSAAEARAGIRADFEMDRDPELRVPAEVSVFPGRLRPLWFEALQRPEADMQRMAADAIGTGHRAGVPDLTGAIPRLVEILTAAESHPAARLAAARALISLDARDAAPQLAQSAEQFGADLKQIVEPALADWSYEPLRRVWESRLKAPATRRRDLLLAIDGLSTTGDAPALPALLELVHDPLQTPDARTAAARAAGIIEDQGLEADAERLIAGAPAVPVLNRLCAVRLVARHSAEHSLNLLSQFAVDAEPAVAIVALTRLIEIAPQRVVPIAESAMKNADPLVRQRGAQAYVLYPDPQRVVILAQLLDDPHPDVRGAVRDWLFDLRLRPELVDPILATATEILAGDRWRGLEQAALLLGAMDHKPVATRLVTLLESKRPEVGIAAAWALKRLAVPETLPPMFDKAVRQTELRAKPGELPRGLDLQTAHLIEAFGRMKYAAAEPLLVRYIPKNPLYGEFSRSAAIWTLGHLHEGTPDESLAAQLLARVTDDNPMPPEWDRVRAMSALSIGRMKAVSQVPALKKYIGPRIPAALFGVAIRWALIELTGEPIPEPESPRSRKKRWFLEPLE